MKTKELPEGTVAAGPAAEHWTCETEDFFVKAAEDKVRQFINWLGNNDENETILAAFFDEQFGFLESAKAREAWLHIVIAVSIVSPQILLSSVLEKWYRERKKFERRTMEGGDARREKRHIF